MTQEAKRTLIFAFLKFLRDEIKQENISADLKESLEVASQCLESSYEISLEDEICKNNFDAGIDLLAYAEKNVIKRELPADLKEKADKHKTEGNELMKQEKFKEALEQYNKAIEIDKNNAVYYCNRAAAYSKLSDFTNSIEDCKNALKIDPSYGKAWGRLGLALLSNNQFEEAFEAYNKAIQLEPANDGYKQNLKIVEEKLKNLSFGAGQAHGGHSHGLPDMGGLGGMMSMFNNPQFMNMANQLMSDPQMQNVMSSLVNNMFGPRGGQAEPGSGTAASETTPAAAPEMESALPPGAGLPPFPGGMGGFDTIFQSAQQLASQINTINPDLVEQMRSQIRERMTTPGEPGAAPGSEPAPAEKKDEAPK